MSPSLISVKLPSSAVIIVNWLHLHLLLYVFVDQLCYSCFPPAHSLARLCVYVSACPPVLFNESSCTSICHVTVCFKLCLFSQSYSLFSPLPQLRYFVVSLVDSYFSQFVIDPLMLLCILWFFPGLFCFVKKALLSLRCPVVRHSFSAYDMPSCDIRSSFIKSFIQQMLFSPLVFTMQSSLETELDQSHEKKKCAMLGLLQFYDDHTNLSKNRVESDSFH